MDITLWRPGEFKKKENSTKQPASGTGTRYTGIARNADPFSLLSPSIVFDFSGVPNIGTSAAPPYTYAYVADFSRYYFIDDWTHDRGLWTAHLRADVLASFKAQIADEDLYVLRASAEYDGNIVDTKYPTRDIFTGGSLSFSKTMTMECQYGGPTPVSRTWGTYTSQGYFTVGLFSSVSEGSAGVRWYQMDYSGFRSFAQKMFLIDSSQWTDIAEPIAIAIKNPVQWVSKVIWTPFFVPGREPTGVDTAVQVGKDSFTIHGCQEIDPQRSVTRFYTKVAPPKHPKAASRGQYLNSPPYTTCCIHMPPLGVVDVDLGALNGHSDDVLLDGVYDFTSGLVTVNFFVCAEKQGKYTAVDSLGTLSGTWGIPVSLTQAAVDILGRASAVVSGATGAAVGIATGEYVQAASAAVGGIVNAAMGGAPKQHTVGGAGSTIAWSDIQWCVPWIEYQHMDIVDEYKSEIGRPLCKVRKPKNIPGYIMANNAKIEITGLKSEEEQIEGYMNGGFFYE